MSSISEGVLTIHAKACIIKVLRFAPILEYANIPGGGLCRRGWSAIVTLHSLIQRVLEMLDIATGDLVVVNGKTYKVHGFVFKGGEIYFSLREVACDD